VSSVRSEVTDDHVARITLDRPDQLNAITIELARELEQAILTLGSREDVHVVVVRGSGGTFCAGGDFGEVERLRAEGPEALRPLFEAFGAACRAIAEVPAPVVAVVEGAATAGGFELMQAADLVLVRDDVKVGDNHIRFGQIPGGGSTQRLPRLVGRQRALGILLGGERFDGPTLVELGLAYASWSAAEFEDRVAAFVADLAARRRDAVVGIKRLVNEGLGADLESGLARELDAVVHHIAGEAGGAGVAAFDTRSRG